MNPEAPNITALPSAPVEYAEQLHQEQAAEISRGAALWNKIRHGAGRLALGLAIVTGGTAAMIAADEKPAQAASGYDCYGDYCTGLYAADTHCAENPEDVKTLETVYITKSGDTVNVTAGPVSVGHGGVTSEVARLELRWSEKCGTAWAKLNANTANDVNYIGVQHDGGYSQDRRIAGILQGSPSGTSTSPMVYSRDRDFQAYASIKSGLIYPPHTVGTYWAKG